MKSITVKSSLRICILIYFRSCSILPSFADECHGPRTPDDISKTLWGKMSNYTDKQTRPNLSKLLKNNPMANPALAGADIVKTKIKLVSLKNMNQKKNEVKIQVMLSLVWNDYRLAYGSLGTCFDKNHTEVFRVYHLQNIWKPYIEVTNEIDDPRINDDAFWVYPNGDVHYGRDLMLNIACELNYKKFPRDTQHCDIILGPWAEDISTIVMELMDSPIDKHESHFDMAGDIEWNITNYTAKTGTYSKDIVTHATFSYAAYSFELVRQSDYYLHFVIFPVILVVTLAWASFFIDRAAVPARTTMTSVSFLTITNFIGGQLTSLPRLGGDDAWLLLFMQISQIFTFYSVLEYAVCNYLFRIRNRVIKVRNLAKENESNIAQSSLDGEQNKIQTKKAQMKDIGGITRMDSFLLKKDGSLILTDVSIDVFSRIAFPILYCVAILSIFFVFHEPNLPF